MSNTLDDPAATAAFIVALPKDKALEELDKELRIDEIAGGCDERPSREVLERMSWNGLLVGEIRRQSQDADKNPPWI